MLPAALHVLLELSQLLEWNRALHAQREPTQPVGPPAARRVPRGISLAVLHLLAVTARQGPTPRQWLHHVLLASLAVIPSLQHLHAHRALRVTILVAVRVCALLAVGAASLRRDQRHAQHVMLVPMRLLALVRVVHAQLAVTRLEAPRLAPPACRALSQSLAPRRALLAQLVLMPRLVLAAAPHVQQVVTLEALRLPAARVPVAPTLP